MVLTSKIESQKKWTCLWKVFFLRFPVKFTGTKKRNWSIEKATLMPTLYHLEQTAIWNLVMQGLMSDDVLWSWSLICFVACRETCGSAKKTWGIKTHPSLGPWTYQENPFINQLICVSTYLPPQMGLLDTQKTLSYRFLERVYMRLWCCTDFVKKFYMKLWCLIKIVWGTGNLIPKR
jgi:hypothetical protein